MTHSLRRFASFLSVMSFFSVPAIRAQSVQKPVQITVDLRDAPKHVFHAKLAFPVKPGPLTLVYPKWTQGEHAPTGPVDNLAGLKMHAAGKEVAWRRDSLDMYAFHVEVPGGAETLEVALDYLSPAESGGSRETPSSSAQIAMLNWYMLTLYPQGAKTADLIYAASLRLPAAWKYGTALPVAKETAAEIFFAPASLATLIDSPVIAGAYFRDIDLAPGQKPAHMIHIAADGAAALQASPEEVQHLRQLVAETVPLFGARHYRRYDFLLTLSEHLPVDGVEHHESSANRTPEALFLDPDVHETQMDLLPHEFVHSWNGKYRRPAGLVATDYQAPLTTDLLWVYEGLTQYYGVMLAARAGFWTPDKLREYLAYSAGFLDDRPGRTWRNLQDTATATQILYGMPAGGTSWRRSVDYYEESALIWLEADTIIRRETKGKQSLDDFCKKFHGGENTGPIVKPYNFEDLVATMNEMAAYDWSKFFMERLETHGPGAPLGGLENSGWKLVYTDVMNEHQRAGEAVDQGIDVGFSLGFQVHAPGGEQSDRILDVITGSPADQAGLAPGMRLIAVDGRRWTPDILREAIRRAKTGKEPIQLLAENGDYFKTYEIDYHGGERYPHLQPIMGKIDVLTEIARMKASPVALPTKY